MSQFHPTTGFVYTPHATNEVYAASLYVGDAGNIVFYPVGNTSPITLTVPAGWWYPGEVKRVLAAGTTCTKIHGFTG